MKRTFDIIGSLIALGVTGPVWVAIAAWIRFDSPGPVIYRQQRVGRGGNLFTIMKFRTMRTEGGGLQITRLGDPRITVAGRFLRQTKLDELPQLINVIRGDMSIVGPRPEVPAFVALWDEVDRRTVLSVRPGITDPASIEFRREEELLAGAEDPEAFYREVVMPRKLALYRDYVESSGLRRDFGIIGKTLRAVAFG